MSDYPDGIPEDVCKLFVQMAYRARRAGKDKYSARTILEVIRWEHDVERGLRPYKCNDHWTPYLARWFLKNHPKWQGFFELREHNERGFGRNWDDEEI